MHRQMHGPPKRHFQPRSRPVFLKVQKGHYRVGMAKERCKRNMKLLSLAIQEEKPPELVKTCLHRFKDEKADVQNNSAIAYQSRSVLFSLNGYSEDQLVREFRFRKADLWSVCVVIGCMSGRTARNGFTCDPVAAC